MDGIYYNSETNTTIFTQHGDQYDSYHDKPEWTRLYSIASQEDLEDDEDEDEDDGDDGSDSIDIFNSSPRKVRCIRNDRDVFGGGMYAHLLEIGKIYNVIDVEVYSWYTVVRLKEFPPNMFFNSVLFEEVRDVNN